jgi:hypothetical protein
VDGYAGKSVRWGDFLTARDGSDRSDRSDGSDGTTRTYLTAAILPPCASAPQRLCSPAAATAVSGWGLRLRYALGTALSPIGMLWSAQLTTSRL